MLLVLISSRSSTRSLSTLHACQPSTRPTRNSKRPQPLQLTGQSSARSQACCQIAPIGTSTHDYMICEAMKMNALKAIIVVARRRIRFLMAESCEKPMQHFNHFINVPKKCTRVKFARFLFVFEKRKLEKKICFNATTGQTLFLGFCVRLISRHQKTHVVPARTGYCS